MARIVILTGSFDDDPSAEKGRLAFGKVNTMTAEIYGTLPQLDPSTLSGQNGKILVVNSAGTAFELAAAPGGGDMLSTNNLSDLTNTSDARTNLGLGTAATTAASAYATAAQGAKADTAVQSTVAGTGISVDDTDPLNPIITNTETNVNAESGAIDYANSRITITLTDASTFNISIPGIKPVIDDMTVDKGSGNTDYDAIEVGDKLNGWLSESRFVAGKVTALPWDTEGNTDWAVDGEIV